MDPVDITRLNFQNILTMYHSDDLQNVIELFLDLTNLLTKQKRYSFNWDSVYTTPPCMFLWEVGSLVDALDSMACHAGDV